MCTVDVPEDCWGWEGDNGTPQTYFLKHLPASPLRRQPHCCHSPWAAFCLISQLQPPISNRLRQISYQIWPFLCPSLAPPTDPRIHCPSLIPSYKALGGGAVHAPLSTSLGPLVQLPPGSKPWTQFSLSVHLTLQPNQPGSTRSEFFHTHVLPSAWNAPSYPSSGSSSSAAAPQEPSQLA